VAAADGVALRAWTNQKAAPHSAKMMPTRASEPPLIVLSNLVIVIAFLKLETKNLPGSPEGFASTPAPCYDCRLYLPPTWRLRGNAAIISVARFCC
jgi:hypothetical protein